jgi:hypothetical protein
MEKYVENNKWGVGKMLKKMRDQGGVNWFKIEAK